MVCVGAAVTFLLAAAVAVAASKSVVNKGDVYIGGTNGQTVTFKVAKNGKSLVDFSGPGSTIKDCGPTVASLRWPTTAKFSGSKFKITIKEASPNQQTVSGTFHANGRITGTIKNTTECLLPPNFRSGPVEHATVSWSGTSEPMGKDSMYCMTVDRHIPGKGPFFFSGIIAIQVKCPTVDGAIGRGSFATTGTTPITESIFGQFSTPGWTCPPRSTSGLYTCTRTGKVKHKQVTETFTFESGT
jgi:hypothetical protein